MRIKKSLVEVNNTLGILRQSLNRDNTTDTSKAIGQQVVVLRDESAVIIRQLMPTAPEDAVIEWRASRGSLCVAMAALNTASTLNTASGSNIGRGLEIARAEIKKAQQHISNLVRG
mgnify:FL=1|tara:strand:- start:28344 stop:28691 length:348 start_codon:yes stop_codon:yes gene_type:complete